MKFKPEEINPDLQKQICKQFNVEFVPSDPESIIGMADNIRSGIMPINGLRHPPELTTCGWYIWAGEEFKDDVDFFKPIHLYHLVEICPMIIKYFGLPPGFRFLTDGKYEDVWEDKSLLNI